MKYKISYIEGGKRKTFKDNYRKKSTATKALNKAKSFSKKYRKIVPSKKLAKGFRIVKVR